MDKNSDKQLSVIEAHVQDMMKNFEDPHLNPNVLEKLVTQMIELLESSKSVDLSISSCRSFFDTSSNWILQNFSSPKLNLVINGISFLLNKLGYEIDIRKEGIFNLTLLRYHRTFRIRNLRANGC